MTIRLEKKNRTITDFVQLEIDGHLLKIQSGKIGKNTISESTKHCGTHAKALDQLDTLKQEYLNKKYVEVSSKKRPIDFNGVYDKAKWHFGGEFPEELDNFQAYVHTGFYLTWIIENGLFDTNGDEHLKSEISKVKMKEMTGAEFFERNLDGVLMDDDLTETGNEFTYNYYEQGTFLDDYSKTLGNDVPTLYHIQDNWENYKKIKLLLDKRFKRWKRSKKSKWWKRN